MAHPVLAAPHFHNEEAAFAYVEAHLWPEGPVCPHCGNCDDKRIGRLTGKSSRPGLRKCYACRKTFTVRDRLDLRGQPFPAAPVATGDPTHHREQEGHQHPPNPAGVQLQHENRLVSDAPHPRDHEARRRSCLRWAAKERP